ncbi:MAG: hypothetical protein ABSB95_04250 [Dissulfurispiraceae bacterium]
MPVRPWFVSHEAFNDFAEKPGQSICNTTAKQLNNAQTGSPFFRWSLRLLSAAAGATWNVSIIVDTALLLTNLPHTEL